MSKFGGLFDFSDLLPPIHSVKAAEKAIKSGIGAGAFVSGLSFLFAGIAFNAGSGNWLLNLINGMIFGIVSCGIWRRQTIFGVAGLSVFIFERVADVILGGGRSVAYWFVAAGIILGFINSLRGLVALDQNRAM